MENLKLKLEQSPEKSPVKIKTLNALGKAALSDTDFIDTSSTESPLTEQQRQEISEKYNGPEFAIENISSHAKEICNIEQDFAKELHREGGRISRDEFEKWEDAFTDEWQIIERYSNDANLSIRNQAEGKQHIRTYFKEEELDQTIEAFAGRFYHIRNRTLRDAINNSDDPKKDKDLERVDSFFASVARHLDFKYPTERVLNMDPSIMESARTRAHNDAIKHLNDLNNLAKKYHTRPFTVRNFWTSDIDRQTDAMASLLRYDRDIVEEYYYQAFSDEEDKRASAENHLRTFGIYR